MTDADKLRRIGLALRDKEALLFENAPLYIKQLECCADLLDAVPPETLRALKEGTWVAVPKKPTVSMDDAAWKAYNSPIWSYAMLYRAMLAAAPAKPEG